MPAGRTSLSTHTYTALKIKRALSEIDFTGRCSPGAGSLWFAPSEGDYWWYSSVTGSWNKLSWKEPIRLNNAAPGPTYPKDPTRSIAQACVASQSSVGMCWKKPQWISTPVPPPLSHQAWKSGPGSHRQLQSTVLSSIPAAMEKWQWLWAGRSVDALGCTQRESRLQREKCTFRQFGLKHEKWN